MKSGRNKWLMAMDYYLLAAKVWLQGTDWEDSKRYAKRIVYGFWK